MFSTITDTTQENNTEISEFSGNTFLERMVKYNFKIPDTHDSNYNEGKDVANETTVNITQYDKKEKGKSIHYPQNNLARIFVKNQKVSFYIRPQKWKGYIFELSDQCFLGRLTDLNNPTTQEVIEIDLHDVSDEDKSLVKLGAAFYLSIGLSSDQNGQRKKEIILRFQRSRKWDVEDLESVLSEVDEQINKFDNWD